MLLAEIKHVHYLLYQPDFPRWIYDLLYVKDATNKDDT